MTRRCQGTLEPIFAAAAETLRGEITLAKLDADSNKKSGNAHGVKGFPTLKIFRNGQAEDYGGPRDTAEGIVAAMRKANTASSTEITTAAELASARNSVGPNKVVVMIGFFANDGADFTAFGRVARKMLDKGVVAYHATSASVLEAAGYYSDGSGIFLYPTKGNKVMYRGIVSDDRLLAWVVSSAVPAVGSLTETNSELYKHFTQSKGVMLIKVFYKGSAPSVPAWTGVKPGVLVRTVLVDTDTFPTEGANFGGVDAVLIDGDTQKQYALPAGAALMDFVSLFLKGSLKTWAKSEPVPPTALPGEVVVVVGATFDAIVMDSAKGVLIEFYAPWCGHCKSLVPKYEELARNFAETDTVAIAKMDATANEMSAANQALFKVEGFPTIFFAPPGAKKKTPKLFEGARDVAEMEAFVNKNME